MPSKPLEIELVIAGEAFNRQAVIHTLRHLAMRAGWCLRIGSNSIGDPRTGFRRILYVTTDDAEGIESAPDDLVILSSRRVAEHLANRHDPIPVTKLPGGRGLPFLHSAGEGRGAGWICGDVVAGAFATMNLWYEEQTRSRRKDGWITWRDDWMSKIGLADPAPLADNWLDEIRKAAERVGWIMAGERRAFLDANFTIILTHDVDYVSTRRDGGLPRMARALIRQMALRRRPLDAMVLFTRFLRGSSRQPYCRFEAIMREEEKRGARSSFQFIASRHHRLDPTYDLGGEPLAALLREMAASAWEICLHGSYMASRTPGRLREERDQLKRWVGVSPLGQRQHYLNFHPSQLFDQVEGAGFRYDLSVGYNDKSGARAGTYFPFHPFNLTNARAYDFWELPFVVMDTTLATSHRFSPRQALVHAQAILEEVAKAGGCVSLIWHQEQLGGLLDPGFERVYYDLLDWIREQGGVLTTGRNILDALDTRWEATIAHEWS